MVSKVDHKNLQRTFQKKKKTAKSSKLSNSIASTAVTRQEPGKGPFKYHVTHKGANKCHRGQSNTTSHTRASTNVSGGN